MCRVFSKGLLVGERVMETVDACLGSQRFASGWVKERGVKHVGACE